jgi:hypothetical protein
MKGWPHGPNFEGDKLCVQDDGSEVLYESDNMDNQEEDGILTRTDRILEEETLEM